MPITINSIDGMRHVFTKTGENKPIPGIQSSGRDPIRQYVFPDLLPRAILPQLVDLCENWAPDLIITENSEFAGRVVAERRNIPYATLKIADLYGYWERHQLCRRWMRCDARLGFRRTPRMQCFFVTRTW